MVQEHYLLVKKSNFGWVAGMLENKLIKYISENYLEDDAEGFDLDTPLLEFNIIDSSALFDLVAMLSKETSVQIPVNEITPSNFSSVRHITKLVSKIIQQQEAISA